MNSNKIKNKNKACPVKPWRSGGFTLIEAIIYSALLALFLFSSILFASNILSANIRVTERNELLVNQEFLEKKLNHIISQSNDIILPLAGDSGSTLALTGSDSSLYPATFSLSNNQIVLSLPGEANVPLTSNRVKITEFSVVHVSILPAIRVTLTLSSINLPSITFTTNLSYVTSQ